jgi:hypothetical protein
MGNYAFCIQRGSTSKVQAIGYMEGCLGGLELVWPPGMD